jgi:hypothetical protein
MKANLKPRPENLPDVAVCTQQWSGGGGSGFNWHNNLTAPALITQDGNKTWPFTTLQNSITVPTGQRLSCGLITQPGTYTYNVSPCLTEGNPRTVIIT